MWKRPKTKVNHLWDEYVHAMLWYANLISPRTAANAIGLQRKLRLLQKSIFTCNLSSIAVTPRISRSCSIFWHTSAIRHCIGYDMQREQEPASTWDNNNLTEGYGDHTINSDLHLTSRSTKVLFASLNIKDHAWYSSSLSSRHAKHNVRKPNWP